MKKLNGKLNLKVKTLIGLVCLFILVFSATTYIKTYSDLLIDFNDDPDYVESGISSNKVYINDLESDYYYYIGLNYTDSDGSLPTTINKNIYNDSNLVQAKITYKSDDGTNKGYVSLSERQDTYIYFKTLVVNNNNTDDLSDDYVLIELIDNPFTSRPNDKGFNGWYTEDRTATISYDNDYYKRYVKVPITYKDNKPEKVDITMTAKWMNAKVSYAGSSFNGAISSLNPAGMKKLEEVKITYEEVDMTGYYYQVTLSIGESYAGYYNANGELQDRGTCWSWSGSGCTYYQKIENENFNENNTYYYLRNNTMTVLDNSTIDRDIISEETFDYTGLNMATYYQKININRGSSISGYYDESGNYVSSGTCNTNGGCTYYKLLQYYNTNNEEEIYNDNNEYYYLVTRDTNILVLNNNIRGSWSNNGNYPFTITSLHNGTKYNITWEASSGVNCYSDTVIENVTVYYGSNVNGTYEPPSGSNTAGVLYGRYNNVKIGRGIEKNGTYYSFRAVLGGYNSNTGSSGSPSKYSFVVESGIYNSISLTAGASNYGGSTIYINNNSVYGNDYDRVDKNNNNLSVYYCASGSWGGNVYATTNNRTSDDIALNLTVKSGSFGTSKYDHSTGIYVGGRYGGTHYAPRKAKIEGGYIYNLIGGPLTNSNRSGVNDTYIYMTGGEVDMITGGAGTTATYGNRIISITGGTINYSVFGGSNGYNGNDGDGTVNGSSYIYIGGRAVIGKESYVDNGSTLFGAEAGSVFGIGNGKSGSSTIGSSDNSYIVIDGKANINNNIYGGGNYGATGVSSSSNSTTTNIVIEDGIIYGSIYGGGNKNGSGSTDTTASVSIIMNGGNVVGAIYGGSNESGTIYGSTNINVNGGEITNVYGGGRGGASSSSTGTFVKDSVNVVIGNNDVTTTPIVNGSVYGGSAFGTVNGTTGDTEVSTSTTNVEVNKGIITNVFGGGEGNNTYTPYVKGNITVTINGGYITNVFGGNDQSGTPNGEMVVNINSGEITNTYGGGNRTSANITNVNLNGGVSTNIYGGSNETGDVNVSNVTTNGGSSSFIYGGNNIGGITNVTNVIINDGDIGTVYGGSNETSIGTDTNVILNGKATNVFGGSNLTGDVPLTNIDVNMGSATNVYGGNNAGGKTSTSNININGGLIDNIFGGGLKAETDKTNINLYFGKVTNIYGGGDEASAPLTYVNLGNGTVDNIYGGSNSSGEVNTSNISNITTNNTSSSGLSVSASFAKGQLNTWDNMGSSITMSTSVNNNTGAKIVEWDLYLITSKSEFESNWSNAKVDIKNNMFHISEINNYYGTNEIANGSSFSFDFNIQSYLPLEEFYIAGYMIKGYDSSGNEYIGSSFDRLNVGTIYGGNNAGGVTSDSNINLTAGYIDYIFGGGRNAITGKAIINLNGIVVNKAIYGGGDKASITDVNLSINNTRVGSEEAKANVYGGGNDASVNGIITTNIDNSTSIYGNFYSGGNEGTVTNVITTNINNSLVSDNVYGGGNKASIGNGTKDIASNLTIDNSTITNVYGGGSAASVLGSTNVILKNNSTFTNVYGGGDGTSSIVSGDETGENNPAKVYGNTNLLIEDNVTVTDSVYGGGNLGMIDGNTNVTVLTAEINKSIYGGGNAAVVSGNTNVYISGAHILESVYAGGNGTTAIVKGNTNLNIDNSSVIDRHVFGGGNAAATGTSDTNNSLGIVNIVGATIDGNVYGGANTSVLYGETTVNIGSSAVNNTNLINSDIFIGGTIFGGGEANASGSEDYDYSFISVTKGITINIDGSGYNVFDTRGSIFGSGNASSTTGYSYINIKNYGTYDDVKKNISLQRANIVTIDNSYISLSGAKDRTNEYFSTLYTLSRIDELRLVNSSSIYLEEGANLLKKLSSLVLVDGNYEKAVVSIDNEEGTFNRNVNNRVYMLDGAKKNLNVATDENALTYGEIYGMAFFGLYSKDKNGQPITALYSDYSYGEVVSSGDIYYFTNGSYVLGRHNINHDITKDGFYTNYPDEEGNNSIIIKYIDPIPKDSDFYTWVIGETVVSYDFELIASKYSTLGTYELSLRNYAKENTTFSVLGVNFSNLSDDIKLVNYDEIPRVADDIETANTVFGLSMKAGQKIINNGTTNFITEGDKDIVGTTSYISENTSSAPSFVFYLYHSKNIPEAGPLGTVTISLAVITPIDDLSNDVQRINIDITLTKALINTNDYEGTITSGEKYEMFATSKVNITSKSSFSTYYSLFIQNDKSPYKDGYHRAFVSTYAFPVNTKITMIDFAEENKPVYYYYVVNEEDYNEYINEFNMYGEVSYNLSKFIKMGSTSSNNNYNDNLANEKYYKNGIAEEEFIFIINFEDSNITSDVLDRKMLMELRNDEGQTLISLLQDTLRYNLYTDSSAIIDLEANLSKNPIYVGDSTNLTVNTNFVQNKINTDVISDTRYANEKLGIKMSIYDENGNLLNASNLLGVNFEYNGNIYYPRNDGTIRINLAQKIANVSSKIIINTENSTLSTGKYKLVIESFGSPDGIYYGLTSSDKIELEFNIIDTIYGLSVDMKDEMLIIDKEKGFTSNGNNSLEFDLNYISELDNPNVRVKLYRRDYTTIYSSNYEEVDLKDFVSNNLASSGNELEYVLVNMPVNKSTYFFYLKDNLVSGTYKIVYSLYDNDNFIGEIYKYLIIK